MAYINHVNVKTADGQVYCCMRNKIVKFNEEQLMKYCVGCRMFGGTAKGLGVECFWEDIRDVSNPYVVVDPFKEFIQNQTRSVSVML